MKGKTTIVGGKSCRVANRIAADCLKAAAQRGIGAEALLKGLSFTVADLRDRSGTIEWDDLMVFMDRLMVAAGGAHELEELVSGFTPGLRPLQAFAGLFVDPRDLYRVVAVKVARSLYPGMAARCIASNGEPVTFEFRTPDGLRVSQGFFLASAAMFRAYPRLIGLPDAQVDGDFLPPLFRWRITPPASRSIPTRASALFAPFTAVLRRHMSPDPTGDLMADLNAADDSSRMMEQVYQIGSVVASCESIERLADAVLDWTETFRCSHVLVSLQGRGRTVDRSRGQPSTDPCFFRELTVAGREVGRLTWSLPHHDPVSVAAIDAVVPWIALGVENCSRRPAERSLDRHLDEARDRWQLTTRQARVLELIARGSANKEIAAALGCSTKGVESHLTTLFRKAGVDSRTALVARLWDT